MGLRHDLAWAETAVSVPVETGIVKGEADVGLHSSRGEQPLHVVQLGTASGGDNVSSEGRICGSWRFAVDRRTTKVTRRRPRTIDYKTPDPPLGWNRLFGELIQ